MCKSIAVRFTGKQRESKILRELHCVTLKWMLDYIHMAVFFDSGFDIGGAKVEIGRYCSIAQNAHYFGENHPMKHASTSPYFYRTCFDLQSKTLNAKA